jgi:O-antigen/teichoic acid export membrane protein
VGKAVRKKKTMENIDKEALKKSRKTALTLALGTTLILLLILFIIIKTIPDPQEQIITLAVSTVILVILILLFGRYRKSKLR